MSDVTKNMGLNDPYPTHLWRQHVWWHPILCEQFLSTRKRNLFCPLCRWV